MCDYEEEQKTNKKYIRVRFSALINYTSFIYRLIISLGFSTVVIRRLPIVEYGLFATLFAIFGLFTPIVSLWMTWVYRIYVRIGVNDIVKTGHFLSYLYALFASFLTVLSLMYIPYVDIIYKYNIFLLMVVIFLTEVLRILYQVYTAFVLGYRPYLIGYASMVSETVRFLSALIFVYWLKMGLLGAILAIFVTFLTSCIFLIYFIFKERIPWPGFGISIGALKLFVKNAYIPLMTIARLQIESSGEKLLTGLASASPVYPAYLGIAGITRRLIGGGGRPLVQSLSPSLLRKPNRKDIEDILRLTFIITFFMISVMISYAKTIISLFNPVYLNGIYLFILYSLISATIMFVNIISTIGIASDRTDLYTSGMGLRKSLLFKNNLIYLAGSIVRFILGASSFLLLYYLVGIRDVNILLVFPITAIAIYLTVAYIFYRESKKLVEYSIPIRELASSIVGIMGVYIVAYITGFNNYVISRISRDYPYVLLIAVQSIVVYISIIYILSPWTRTFIRKGYEHVFGKVANVINVINDKNRVS